jgi:hypothetical protein
MWSVRNWWSTQTERRQRWYMAAGFAIVAEVVFVSAGAWFQAVGLLLVGGTLLGALWIHSSRG